MKGRKCSIKHSPFEHDGGQAYTQKELDDMLEEAKVNKGKGFTQAQVNTMLADNKRELREKNEGQALKLDEMSKNAGLSEQTILDLRQQAEDLRTEHMTNVEKASRLHSAEVKALKEANKTLDENVKAKDASLAKRVIGEEFLKAATDNGALKPKHLIGLLPNAPKVTTGEDGELKVTVLVGDKELSPDDAVKAMKADVDEYGDYFGNAKAPGQGGAANDGNPEEIQAEDVDSEEMHAKYMEQEAKKSGTAPVENASGASNTGDK